MAEGLVVAKSEDLTDGTILFIMDGVLLGMKDANVVNVGDWLGGKLTLSLYVLSAIEWLYQLKMACVATVRNKLVEVLPPPVGAHGRQFWLQGQP